MGTVLKSTFEAQLDREIATVEDGIHWVQRQFPLVARSWTVGRRGAQRR